MFVRKKKNNSGSTSIQIIQKQKGKYKVVKTLGPFFDEEEIKKIYRQAQEAKIKRVHIYPWGTDKKRKQNNGSKNKAN